MREVLFDGYHANQSNLNFQGALVACWTKAQAASHDITGIKPPTVLYLPISLHSSPSTGNYSDKAMLENQLISLLFFAHRSRIISLAFTLRNVLLVLVTR